MQESKVYEDFDDKFGVEILPINLCDELERARPSHPTLVPYLTNALGDCSKMSINRLLNLAGSFPKIVEAVSAATGGLTPYYRIKNGRLLDFVYKGRRPSTFGNIVYLGINKLQLATQEVTIRA